MNTFSYTYLLLINCLLSTHCFGMNNILDNKQFNIKDLKNDFATLFLKESKRTGQSIEIFPFKIQEKYENIPVKVNIRTQYPHNKNYVSDIEKALPLVSMAYTVNKVEKNNQTVEFDIDIKPLEEVLFNYDAENKNSLKQTLDNDIEKKKLYLETIKKECVQEQDKLNETKRILSLKAKQPEELDERIKYKKIELENLDKVIENKKLQNKVNDILQDRDKIRKEIEQETPFYKKEPWIPFVLGISTCLFVQQAKTYIYSLKTSKEEEKEEYPVFE